MIENRWGDLCALVMFSAGTAARAIPPGNTQSAQYPTMTARTARIASMAHEHIGPTSLDLPRVASWIGHMGGCAIPLGGWPAHWFSLAPPPNSGDISVRSRGARFSPAVPASTVRSHRHRDPLAVTVPRDAAGHAHHLVARGGHLRQVDPLPAPQLQAGLTESRTAWTARIGCRHPCGPTCNTS